jgi:hypothetical protein
MDMCVNCPFYGHPTIVGASVLTGHVRFCRLLDPAHVDYNPRLEPYYREITAGLNGITPESCGVLTTRYQKRGPVIPNPGPPPNVPIPKPEQLPIVLPRGRSIAGGSPDAPALDAPALDAPRVPMHADPEVHARVYEAARTCEHKRTVEGCCGPTEHCGPSGVHPGDRVGISICYPCSSDRLGIELPPPGDEPIGSSRGGH